MTEHARTARILISLVLSMCIGAVVLMMLDKKAPNAGAFSLTSYTRLDSVENVTYPSPLAAKHTWDRIEVVYSDTVSGDVEKLEKLHKVQKGGLNFHFVVCNGMEKPDGLIEATSRWKSQLPCEPDKRWYGSSATIRVCVVSDGIKTMPTEYQLRRTGALVEKLSRKYSVTPEKIRFPSNWQL